MAEEMTSVTPPTSPFAGMLGSTTYTEEERGVDFGVAPVIDSGAHVWGAMQDVAKFATNFYSNIKDLEFKRKYAEKKKAEDDAKKKQQADRDDLLVRIALATGDKRANITGLSLTEDTDIRKFRGMPPWLQQMILRNRYRRPQ
jgi:hypothetical protein